MIGLILLVFAFVLCLIAAFWNPPRVGLLALGIAMYLLSILLGTHLPLAR